MIKVENKGQSNKANGTSLSGYVDISYDRLVSMFGDPLTGDDVDGYKVDAEWHIHLHETHDNERGFVTIYNYKDGRNYLQENGLDVHEITEWHVGSKSAVDYHMLLEYAEHMEGKS